MDPSRPVAIRLLSRLRRLIACVATQANIQPAFKSITQTNLYREYHTNSPTHSSRASSVGMEILCAQRRSTAGSHPRQSEGLLTRIQFAVSKGRHRDKLRPMALPELYSPCSCNAAAKLYLPYHPSVFARRSTSGTALKTLLQLLSLSHAQTRVSVGVAAPIEQSSLHIRNLNPKAFRLLDILLLRDRTLVRALSVIYGSGSSTNKNMYLRTWQDQIQIQNRQARNLRTLSARHKQL